MALAEAASRQRTLPTNSLDAASANAIPAPDTLPRQHSARSARSTRGEQRPRAGTAANGRPTGRRRRPSLRHVADSTEQLRVRANSAGRGSGAARGSARKPPPDGGSGARSGRQFTVGNIGHNGTLYLRPVVRPGNERSRPPAPPFVNAPPRRSLLIAESAKWARPISDAGLEYSRATSPSTPPPRLQRSTSDAVSDRFDNRSPEQTPSKADSLRRSQSFSTIDDHIYTRSATPGTFRIVIRTPERKKKRRRPQESEDDDLPEHLRVPIPSHRIGKPEFGARGTPILRISSYGTGSIGHRLASARGSRDPASALSRRHSDMSHINMFRLGELESTLRSPQRQLDVYARRRDFAVHAAAFDHLEKAPVDPALIKFAEYKGLKKRRIQLATPLCLVAQITSSTNVDYELTSDFFMTFRHFMKPKQLLEILHDRFLWAVLHTGDANTTVRVRTFVAMRHWVVNYMNVDFAPDLALRVEFCSLLNDLFTFLKEPGVGVGSRGLQEIAELKKCWRYYLAEHGLANPTDNIERPLDPIEPGGRPASQLYDLSKMAMAVPEQLSPVQQDQSNATASGVHSRYLPPKTAPALSITQAIQHGQQPSTTTGATTAPTLARSANTANTHDSIPMTRGSEMSAQVLSCSIPFRPVHRPDHGDEIALYRQQAPRTVALPPQVAGPSKAARPRQVRRTESPENAVSRSPERRVKEATSRETIESQSQPSPSQPIEQSPYSVPMVIPGDLVRGRAIPPVPPETDFVLPKFGKVMAHDRTAQGSGMRLIVGSIRRALSQSKPSGSSGHRQPEQHQSARGTAGPNSFHSGSSDSWPYPPSRQVQMFAVPRIDCLGEKSLESFNRIAAEYMASPKKPQAAYLSPGVTLGKQMPTVPQKVHLPPSPEERMRNASGNVTLGSRSIVIMHDGKGQSHEEVERAYMPDSLPPAALKRNLNGDFEASETPTPMIVRTTHCDDLNARGEHWPLGDTAAGAEIRETELGLGRLNSPRDDLRGQSFSPSAPSQMSYTTYDSTAGPTSFVEGRQLHRHQFSDASDPVLPDDPQPVRSLRRRQGGNLRQGIPDFQQEPQADAGAGFQDVEDHESLKSVSDSHVSIASANKVQLPQLPPAGPLGPAVEDVLRGMNFPDDPSEDGTPEVALLKLEGKYVSPEKPSSPVDEPVGLETEQPHPEHTESQERFRHRHDHVVDAHAPIHEPRESAVLSQADIYTSRGGYSHHHPSVSEQSYSSIPLLERGDDRDQGMRGVRRLRIESDSEDSMSNFRFPANQPYMGEKRPYRLRLVNPDPSYEQASLERGRMLPEAGGGPNNRHGATAPVPSIASVPDELTGGTAFGGDEVADRADSVGGGSTPRMKSFLDDESLDTSTPLDNDSAFVHPLRHLSTPPPTAGEHAVHGEGVRMSNGLPTPAQSPPAPPSKELPRNVAGGVYVPTGGDGEEGHGFKMTQEPSIRPPKHSPFILKFEPEELVQAMTMIEQSALLQVNWQELIDLSWTRTGLDKVRDWSAFVLPQPRSNSPTRMHGSGMRRWSPPKSVDIVIARFNVVLRWAVSEIVLIESTAERAACITHYIRIAVAAREMRNFATMYQVTMALLSVDISDLKETWELVPIDAVEALDELEELVKPTRNWSSLRVQQEGVVVGRGCIPFFGIYTSDLTFNDIKLRTVERPPTLGHTLVEGDLVSTSYVAHGTAPPDPARHPETAASHTVDGHKKRSREHVEPLVNFERYQEAARIVKTVLRLIDASRQYSYQVDPALLSKCLWMTALGDEEVRARSKALQMQL